METLWHIGLGIALGSGGAIALTWRLYVRPIRELIAKNELVAKGDLSNRVHDGVPGQVGALIRGRNHMIGQIESIARGITKATSELRSVAVAQNQAVDETRQSAQEIGHMAGHLADHSQRQSLEIGLLSDAFAKLVDVIERVDTIACRVDASASAVATVAADGSRAVDQTVSQAEAVQVDVSESVALVHQLDSRAQEIGQIVGIIGGIATQTNLLALNAAIEAARAGEQGRGFAIVADEVRKLADESRLATNRIQELVEQMQGETRHSLASIERQGQRVQAGFEDVRGTSRIFAEIQNQVAAIAAEIRAMTGEFATMRGDSRAMVKAAQEVVSIAEQNTASSQELSATVHEQERMMAALAATVHTMGAVARDLDAHVADFKLADRAGIPSTLQGDPLPLLPTVPVRS